MAGRVAWRDGQQAGGSHWRPASHWELHLLWVCGTPNVALLPLVCSAGGEEAESLDPNMPWGRGVLKPGGSLVMKLLQGTGKS